MVELLTNAPAPVVVETIPGGPRVILLPSTANDIVAATVFQPLPGAIERDGEAGLVRFLHHMLLRGTVRRTAAELAEAIDGLGISLESEGGDDHSHAKVVATSDTFTEAFDLLAEVLHEPSFEPEEIEKERQSTLAAIRRKDDDKLGVTMRRFSAELFPGHGYGLPRLGRADTVGEFTRAQLVDLHGEAFDPAAYLVVVVGNFDPDAVRATLAAKFAARPEPPAPFVIAAPPAAPPAHAVIRRDSEQAMLVMGYRAPRFGDPAWPATRLMNTVLGEGMSSRLFMKLRDEQGLAYATGSGYAPQRVAGHLYGYIGTSPGNLEKAKAGMRAQFARIAEEPVPADELLRAKNYLAGRFLIDHQTNLKRAYYLGFYESHGAGAAMDETYPDLIHAVTADQILHAAQAVFAGEPTVVELIPNS